MWISKKEWENLIDIKTRFEDVSYLEYLIKHIEEQGGTCTVNTECLLVGFNHYVNLVNDLRTANDKLKESQKQQKKYEKLYLNELQKRLELADRVRELEGE